MELTVLAADVLDHAALCAPRECCGLAIERDGQLSYVPARNRAPAQSEFEIDPADWAAAEDLGTVVGICHSHVGLPPTPSMADHVMCRRTGMPWLIVSWPTRAVHVLRPNDALPAPLVGRPFVHGVLDCYSLIRDYYQQMGHLLPDFERTFEWWLNGGDLYRDGISPAGFVRVFGSEFDLAALKPHDVLLMQVASPVPNHGAIYLGDGRILHHVQGQLSREAPYGGYWRRATTQVIRHRACLP